VRPSKLRRLRAPLFGAVAAALVLCTATALAGSGVGGIFNLGQTNTVNGTSTLTGTSAGEQLKVTNGSTLSGAAGIYAGSGSATGAAVQGVNLKGGPALQATVKTTAPPLKVNSSTKVVNLNADQLDGFDSSVFSHRQIPSAGNMQGLSTVGDVGQYTSATVGEDGLGLISYYDATNKRLMVAHCSNLACTSVTRTPIDTGGFGEYTSIALGSDGLGLISYVNTSQLVLRVAHCSNILCTSATTKTLDPIDAGGYTSIAISGDGYGLVSYYSTQAGGSLKVAHCTNVQCTGANTYTIDSGGGVSTKGLYTSITTVGSGLGLISYYDLTNGNLKTAYCTTFSCSSSVTTTVNSSPDDVGRWTSITRGADGLGVIAYQNATTGQIEVAHCLSEQCIAVTSKGIGPGVEDSIAVGADGLPMLTYYYSGGLAIYHCVDASCSNVTGYIVGSTGQFGQYSGITIGTDGFPLISFYDAANGDLWALHCSNPYCTAYFRRR
jgi:hypothetical protein